jgi:single-strand DNA-binding protein
MTAQKMEHSDVAAGGVEYVNEVRLVGRLLAVPVERHFASGESVVNLRIAVERPPGPARERQKSDSIDLAIWRGSAKSRVLKWVAEDVVEVTGSLQHRFFRLRGLTTARSEIEVASAKRLRRGVSG